MKKQLTLLFLFIAGAFCTLHAEYVWKAGYLVMTSGDSLKGEIKINTNKELNQYSKVMFRQGENMKSYKPTQVKEYGYDGVRFLARTVDGDMHFLKVISYGHILLFQYQFEMYHGQETVVDEDYYLQKNDGDDADPVKVKANKFKKLVAEMMADHSELVEQVQNEDKKFEIGDMQQVVDEYNNWYKQQNPQVAGTH